MNAIIESITEAFTQRQRSDAEQYWRALTDKKADPDLLMTLADRLGKDLNAMRIDAELLEQLSALPQPDESAHTKAMKKIAKDVVTLQGEIAELKKITAEKVSKLEALSSQRSYKRDEHTRATGEYQTLIRQLAERGHPGCSEQIRSAEAARNESRQAKLTAHREKTLKADIKRIRESLNAELSKPEKRRYSSVIGSLETKLKRAENELQGLESGA